jgi:hypothetical protein
MEGTQASAKQLLIRMMSFPIHLVTHGFFLQLSLHGSVANRSMSDLRHFNIELVFLPKAIRFYLRVMETAPCLTRYHPRLLLQHSADQRIIDKESPALTRIPRCRPHCTDLDTTNLPRCTATRTVLCF